jgi:hypothetical protein
VIVAGLFFVGVVGSYLHVPPLMYASVDRADAPAIVGRLVGKGTDGEWYVATQTSGKGDHLEVIGGATEQATRVVIEPADDRDFRTLYYQITDDWLKHGSEGDK